MREGRRTLGRAGVRSFRSLAREPTDAGQAVGHSDDETGEIGRAARRKALLHPTEIAAERRHGPRSRTEAEGPQERPVGDRPPLAGGRDQEPLEPVQVDQGWPPSIG